MSEPRFKIGDLVVCKSHQHANALLTEAGEKEWLSGYKSRIIIGQVLEMIEQTCPGGMQRKYIICFATADGVDGTAQQRLEIELDPAPEVPVPYEKPAVKPVD